MILTKIREKTMVYHDDFTGWANKILNGTATLDDYKEVLKTFYGFYQPLENKLESLSQWKETDFNIEGRRKAQLILQDMKNLGISEQEISEIAICSDAKLPEINNIAQALGCMYVVEGATLGGQIIAKKLQELFSLNADNGAAFFNSYGENLRPMWKTFGDFINNYSEQTKIEEPIVNSSDETYHSFNNWLAKLRS